MGPREVVLSAIVPTVAALMVLVVAHALVRRRRRAGNDSPKPPTLAWLVPPLVAAGVILGSWAWQSRVDVWAESVTHRFPAIALAALAAGLVSSLLGALAPLGRRPLFAALPAALGGAFAGWAVLGGLHESLISETARWGWVAGVGLIAGAHAWAIGLAGRTLPGWRAPALLWLLLGTIALGATAGFANAPLVMWPASGVAFALAAAGLLRKDADLLAGASPVFAVLIAGVVSFSHWFGDTERWAMFALLMASPLPLALAALPVFKARPLARLVVPGVIALGLAGAQAGIAVPALLEASGGGGGEYYDY